MRRQEWLQAAAFDPPCGPSLEYDQDYLALEQAARGREEQQYGDTVIPAQEPDWVDVVNRASALLDRSRDLRIVRLLARGLTRIQALPGLCDGLALTRDLLANFWEPLHPRLEFDGEPDPVMRTNALAAYADNEGLVRDVRLTTFLRCPLGNFTVRDVEKILDSATGAAGHPVTPEQLRSAIRDAIIADAGALTEAGACVEALDGIRTILLEHLEPMQVPDLAPLRSVLKTVSELAGTIRAEVAWQPEAGTVTAAGRDAREVVGVGEIRSREEAVRALDRVCDFLARHEPTNPAPLLIRRAQRLMTMPFLDIIRELAPDAARQVETITGASQG